MIPTPPPALTRAGAALALVLLAGACTDDLAGPGGGPGPAAGPRLAALADDGGPELVPNERKYGDAGAKPATGRSGSATLTARALRDRWGTTVLDVTTGTLDDTAAAPGTLAKVQLKVSSPDGTPMYDAVLPPATGGSTRVQLDGMVRGQRIQVQANVRGIDPARTDVVTLTETVKLRPKLRVHFTPPATVPFGVPVNLSAVVAETNGDAGARADCLLVADGAVVDQARGIWVDAGDAVTCAFTHTFRETGGQSVAVRLAGVSPADYDGFDHAAAALVQVTNGPSNVDYTASVYEFLYRWHILDEQRWSNDATGQSGTARAETEDAQLFQGATLSTYLPRAVGNPLTRLELTQSTGGRVVHSAVFDSLGGPEYEFGGFFCLDRYDGATGVQVYLCSHRATPGYESEWTQLTYDRRAGEVTYHSRHYAEQWDGAGASEWVYHVNVTRDGTTGAFVPFGDDYRFTLRMTDGDSVYATAPVVAVTGGQPYETRYGPACYDGYGSFYFTGLVHTCTTWVNSGYAKQGFTTGLAR